MLAKGVATLVSAPAPIRMKKECLVESGSTETGQQDGHQHSCSAYQLVDFQQEVPVLLPGLLAMEQTKSALRGRRRSCKVMEPLEADTDPGSGAAEVFVLAAGSPFKRSSSAFKDSLFSAEKQFITTSTSGCCSFTRLHRTGSKTPAGGFTVQ